MMNFIHGLDPALASAGGAGLVLGLVLGAALGIALGGPTTYSHGTVDKPWLGDPTAQNVDSRHIRTACRLVTCAGYTAVTALALLLVA